MVNIGSDLGLQCPPAEHDQCQIMLLQMAELALDSLTGPVLKQLKIL